jgi:hypothetical protein
MLFDGGQKELFLPGFIIKPGRNMKLTCDFTAKRVVASPQNGKSLI